MRVTPTAMQRTAPVVPSVDRQPSIESPERPTSRRRIFPRAHADVITAASSFNVEICSASGLVTHYVPFVISWKGGGHGQKYASLR